MFKKKLLSLALAWIMMLSLSAPAMAVDASGNTGNTPVEVTADAAIFSVTLPTSIAFHINDDATVICPSNLKIQNGSSAPIEVSGIEIQNGTWTIADYNNGDRSVLAAEKIGANKLGLALTPNGGTQSATSTDGTQELSIEAAEWTVGADGMLSFDSAAIATAVKDEIADAIQAAKVVFTVGWKTNNYSGAFLTFSSPSSFTLKTYNGAKNWDGTLEYSTDTTTWTTWDGTTELSSVGNSMYLRGTGNSKITGNSSDYRWVLTGSDITCSGNIEMLLDYATVQAGGHPTMGTWCYAYMFRGCTSLTTAPALSATTLTTKCYNSMFDGCTSLTTAPALPATTLASSCYDSMFYNCTSLTTAPVLPATTLVYACYYNMFRGCTSLITAPALPAITLASYCYWNMFNGCTSLKLSKTQTEEYTQDYRVPFFGSGTTAEGALTGMFAGTNGTFTGTPAINTTYYLHSSNRIVG